MEELLRDILNRLKAQCADFRYIDEDWGQLDYYSPNFPVQWPCCLIDTTNETWSNEGRKIQIGLITVTIRIANIRLGNSSGQAPENLRTQAFFVHTLKKEVYKALHGWHGSQQYSGLIRTGGRRIKRDDGIQLYEVTYTTEIKDASAMYTMNVAPSNTQINITTGIL